jgi:hypothetical protein
MYALNKRRLKIASTPFRTAIGLRMKAGTQLKLGPKVQPGWNDEEEDSQPKKKKVHSTTASVCLYCVVPYACSRQVACRPHQALPFCHRLCTASVPHLYCLCVGAAWRVATES